MDTDILAFSDRSVKLGLFRRNMNIWSVRIKTNKTNIIPEWTPTAGSAVGLPASSRFIESSSEVNGNLKQSAIGLILGTDPPGC
jgi:hypothetical protein